MKTHRSRTSIVVALRSLRSTFRNAGRLLGALVVLGMAVALAAPAGAADNSRRPNIVVIVADDMGFADMGAFSSEIKTPNLDALAKDGVRFTNFYTHASCSPTRSVLLSGVDTHLNGLGNMDEWTAPNQRGVPGYTFYRDDYVRLKMLTFLVHKDAVKELLARFPKGS